MTKEVKFHFESPDENLGYLLWQTTMLWQRHMNRALDEVGLTHTQYVILMALAWLSRTSENVTQKDIAEHSNTDRMMVSKILKSLQGKKIIKRHEHETDTRAKCVVLTEKGVDILQKAIEVKNGANDQFFKNIKAKNDFGKELSRLIK